MPREKLVAALAPCELLRGYEAKCDCLLARPVRIQLLYDLYAVRVFYTVRYAFFYAVSAALLAG